MGFKFNRGRVYTLRLCPRRRRNKVGGRLEELIAWSYKVEVGNLFEEYSGSTNPRRKGGSGVSGLLLVSGPYSARCALHLGEAARDQ
jgi:hypothetical protein